jgi:DNA-binding MarR family transcriptional regulator
VRSAKRQEADDVLEVTLRAADVLLRVVARTVIAVEDDVTGPQLRVLVLMFRDGPTTPSAVAAELNVHASNATRVCSRLERAGFIGRLPASSDRRLRRFDLTTSGRALVRDVMAQRRTALGRILDRLSEREAEQLRSALDTFAQAAATETERDGGLTLTAAEIATVTETLPPQKPAKPAH